VHDLLERVDQVVQLFHDGIHFSGSSFEIYFTSRYSTVMGPLGSALKCLK
jgi:hypothetical protein